MLLERIDINAEEQIPENMLGISIFLGLFEPSPNRLYVWDHDWIVNKIHIHIFQAELENQILCNASSSVFKSLTLLKLVFILLSTAPLAYLVVI